MTTKILSNKNIAVWVALAISASAIFGSAVYAKSIFDIEFPVVELGNCKDKAECKAYCAVAEHQTACENFAATYGIAAAQDQKQVHETRKELIAKDGGPGKCAVGASDPEKSCRAYCSVSTHMSECVAYGKEHGLMKGKELDDAEKVVKALEGGAELPAGCTDEQSCKQTCEEPKNVDVARSCFAFAEKAGILPPGVDRDRAEKVFKLIEDGKSPFKSIKEFKQCENPGSDAVMQKCISFGADNGLMSAQDVEIVKKTGGKGPGDCRGKDQCELYCSEHQDECMLFAEKHDLIKPEDKARMQEGMTKLKESIANAPEGAKQCLSDVLGESKLTQILAGQSFAARESAEKIRGCFEKAFGGQMGGFQGIRGGDETGMMQGEGTSTGRGFRMGEQGFPKGVPPQGMQLPPQVAECLKNKIGEDAVKSLTATMGKPDEKVGQAMSECFRSVEGPQGSNMGTPGGCQGEAACTKFCSDPANASACKSQFERGENVPREVSRPNVPPQQGSSTLNIRRPGGPEGQFQPMYPPNNQGIKYEDGQFNPNNMMNGQPPMRPDDQRMMNEGQVPGGYGPPPGGFVMPTNGGTYSFPEGAPYPMGQ